MSTLAAGLLLLFLGTGLTEAGRAMDVDVATDASLQAACLFLGLSFLIAAAVFLFRTGRLALNRFRSDDPGRGKGPAAGRMTHGL